MTNSRLPALIWPALSWVVSLATVASLSSVTPAAAAANVFATLVAAERAFARDAGRIGISAAFRAHAATDAVLIQPDPAPAAKLLAGPDGGSDTLLQWEPAFAGLARSNDLGFTTGPYRLRAGGKMQRGQYLTVWQRDGEGQWKWFLDHGSYPVAGDLAAPFPTDAVRMRPSASAAPDGSAEAADTALNAALVRDGNAALSAVMADDALMLRPGQAPMSRRHAAADGTARGMAEQIAMRVSKAGDLAVSYGRMTAGPDARAAHYVRVWRRDRAGWRIVIDELTWRQP